MAKKIYCYVDETGQDTKGKLFIVVAIIVEKEREMLEKFLEKAETVSKKGYRKWQKTSKHVRLGYLDTVFVAAKFKNAIYYQIFTDSSAYSDLTALTIAQAINRYVTGQHVKKYEATILIDGLKKTEQPLVTKTLRNLGVKIRKIRGVRDESSALIRLADAVAGLARQIYSGNQSMAKVHAAAVKTGVIHVL